jgi:hypothetical protein
MSCAMQTKYAGAISMMYEYNNDYAPLNIRNCALYIIIGQLNLTQNLM